MVTSIATLIQKSYKYFAIFKTNLLSECYRNSNKIGVWKYDKCDACKIDREKLCYLGIIWDLGNLYYQKSMDLQISHSIGIFKWTNVVHDQNIKYV